MCKNIRNLINSFLLLIVTIVIVTSKSLAKFEYTGSGLAWESFFSVFFQGDEDFKIEDPNGGQSNKMYGPDSTFCPERNPATSEDKDNVYETYFITQEDYNQLMTDNKFTLDSISDYELNVRNSTNVDMLITFNIHYYAPKAVDDDPCLQFAIYNTKYGKISAPFDDTTGRVMKGEFIQVADGEIESLSGNDYSSVTDPFNTFAKLKLENGEELVTQTSSSKESELENVLSIRYGGDDKVVKGSTNYYPYNAFINQYRYGAVETSGSWFWQTNKITSRYLLTQTYLADFIVKKNTNVNVGYNITVQYSSNSSINTNCFISAITFTATPCKNIWTDYVE